MSRELSFTPALSLSDSEYLAAVERVTPERIEIFGGRRKTMNRTDWLLNSQYPAKKGKRDPLFKALAFALACLLLIGVIVAMGLLDVWSAPPTGDVNGDGRVNAIDLTMMARHMAGTYDLTPAQIRTGDMNRNGRIDQQDIDTLVDMLLERPAN